MLKFDRKDGHGNLFVSIIDIIQPINSSEIRNGPSILIAQSTQNTPQLSFVGTCHGIFIKWSIFVLRMICLCLLDVFRAVLCYLGCIDMLSEQITAATKITVHISFSINKKEHGVHLHINSVHCHTYHPVLVQ